MRLGRIMLMELPINCRIGYAIVDQCRGRRRSHHVPQRDWLQLRLMNNRWHIQHYANEAAIVVLCLFYFILHVFYCKWPTRFTRCCKVSTYLCRIRDQGACRQSQCKAACSRHFNGPRRISLGLLYGYSPTAECKSYTCGLRAGQRKPCLQSL